MIILDMSFARVQFFVSIMKHFFLVMLCVLVPLSGTAKVRKTASPYLVATDFVKADGVTDAADGLQKLIDDNPNRTIYFPDGVYMLSHSIKTPADPTKAVHLVLANFAVLKAMEGWEPGTAILRLGGEHPYNSITIDGSNYGIEGGVIDGMGVADGINIESGRETRVCRVSIKHTRIGLHILYGANSGSSDSDIRDVNIVGNDTVESIGVLSEGFDNTFTNMRIASVHVGVWCKSAGNKFTNIHSLYIFNKKQEYDTSCGFIFEVHSENWCDYCYSDQFATGFKLGGAINMTDCFAMWYSGKVPFQTAISCEGKFEAFASGMHLGFSPDCPDCVLLKAETGGKGCILNVRMRPDQVLGPSDVSEAYTTRL